MDALSLILAALATGAAASVKDTASEMVKDSYSGLKALIQRKFASKSKAERVLIEYEEDPETYEKPLKKALIEEHLEQDQDVIIAAQELMTLVQPQQAALGKFSVQVTGGTVNGVNQGDQNTITQYFGSVPQDSKHG